MLSFLAVYRREGGAFICLATVILFRGSIQVVIGQARGTRKHDTELAVKTGGATIPGSVLPLFRNLLQK